MQAAHKATDPQECVWSEGEDWCREEALCIPSGEKTFLFQYIVSDVNPDCKALTLDYEYKYIEVGGTQFKN
jgi:hypothetical protein